MVNTNNNIKVIEDFDIDTLVAVHDNIVRVDWVNIGEGHCGEYNPDDPTDENLLRFDVYVNANYGIDDEPDWKEIDDGSYCTHVPATTPTERLIELCKILHRRYTDVIDSYPIEFSVKKLGEELSWISP